MPASSINMRPRSVLVAVIVDFVCEQLRHAFAFAFAQLCPIAGACGTELRLRSWQAFGSRDVYLRQGKCQIVREAFVSPDEVHRHRTGGRVDRPVEAVERLAGVEEGVHRRPTRAAMAVVVERDHLVPRVSLEAELEVGGPDSGSQFPACLDGRHVVVEPNSVGWTWSHEVWLSRDAVPKMVLRASTTPCRAHLLVAWADGGDDPISADERRQGDFNARACRLARAQEDEAVRV